MTDVPDLCDRLRAFHSKIMNEAADALEQEVKNWKQRNNSALAAEAQRDALVKALTEIAAIDRHYYLDYDGALAKIARKALSRVRCGRIG